MKYLLFFFSVLLSSSSFAASYSWKNIYNQGAYSSPQQACQSTAGSTTVTAIKRSETTWYCNTVNGSLGDVTRVGDTCPWLGYIYDSSTGTCKMPTCPAGTSFDVPTGTCKVSNPCTVKNGKATTWKKTWPSFADSSSMGEKVNNSGCSATIGSMTCGTNGSTGEFACWGTAIYDGSVGVDSTGPSSACGATDPNCASPEPLTSTNTQKCTPNADGTTTCVTESGSTEFASGECHVGSTGGSTGFVCVKPDYVPEAATNKRTDVIKTDATADGGTKTTTTSTSENKHCVAGVCTNTTTTTTTTTTKDGAGKVTSETSACTGAKCDKPTDETEPEEEGMGEAKFSGKGGCEGSECDVDAFNPFGTDVVPGYSDSLNAALTGIKRSPIGSAVSNIRWPTGGSCPVYSMQLFNSSISITEHCTVWDSVGSALSAVFLAIWAFAAVRVFLSA